MKKPKAKSRAKNKPPPEFKPFRLMYVLYPPVSEVLVLLTSTLKINLQISPPTWHCPHSYLY